RLGPVRAAGTGCRHGLVAHRSGPVQLPGLRDGAELLVAARRRKYPRGAGPVRRLVAGTVGLRPAGGPGRAGRRTRSRQRSRSRTSLTDSERLAERRYVMSDTDAHPLPGTTCDPLCPDSDGFPMGETDFHIAAIIWLREALEDFFADHPDVYVASNLLLYFRVGSLRERRDPDVLVAKGVGKHQRRSFRTWEENTVPCVVFEISSEKTWEVDLYEKRIDYRRLGIGEYFLFDPESRFLNPPLQGFRLAKRKYVPIPLAPDGSLTSQELGLRLLPEGG